MKKSRELQIMLDALTPIILLDDSLVSAVKRGLLQIRRERHEQNIARKQKFKGAAARDYARKRRESTNEALYF